MENDFLSDPKTQVRKGNLQMDYEIPSIIEFMTDDSEPIPVGEYIGVIEDVEIKKNSLLFTRPRVTFHISAKQCPMKPKFEHGEHLIYRRLSFEETNKDRYFLKLFIQAIGAPLGKKINVKDWVGQKARIAVKHDKAGFAYISYAYAV
jgi:hypothetical protein